MTATSPTESDALRQSVRGLLTKRSDSAAVRAACELPTGYDPALWTALVEQIGVAALAIPVEYGGVGASLTETHVVAEELGRALTPSPMLGSAVLAAQLLLALGDADANARLLPAVAEGAVAALCWAGEDGHWDPARPAVSSHGLTLTGTAHYVLDGDSAQLLLVAARTPDGVAVFEVAPESVSRVHTPSMDPTRRLARVEFDATPAAIIGTPGDACVAALTSAKQAACVALSAEQVGAAARCLEMTVAYTKVRVQFGRPIGSFQALKHRMADLHVLVESARSASWSAVGGGVPAPVAKAYCSEAFSRVAAEMIQLHGGIAITWEHDAHLYFKRAHSSAQLFGQPAEHIAESAHLAGL